MKLNYLTANEYYQQTLSLAKAYCPEWTEYWPATLDTNTDPGLVLLKLFSSLAGYLSHTINQIPDQKFITYLSFMTLSLGYPNPASVQLTFTTKTQADETLLLANTAVASAIDPKLTFYLEKDLQVLPLDINVALYINPDQDTYIDQTSELDNDKSYFSIFDDQNSQALSHLLLLGDNVLFSPTKALQNLQIVLHGSNLYKEYFMQWFDDLGNPLEVTFKENDTKTILTIDFVNSLSLINNQTLEISSEQLLLNLLSEHATIGKSTTTETLSAETYYWIAVEPAQNVRILKNYQDILPKINTISCNTSGSNIAPQTTLYNSTLLNSKNGVYPFSQMPQIQDAYYIGSDDVFNRPGADVKLNFSINPAADSDLTVELAWEFWNGQAWQDLATYITQNTTNNFVASSSVISNPSACLLSFTCPDIKSLVISGQESLWVRARIANGNYALQVQSGGTSEIVYYPPFIYSVNIDYYFSTNKITQCLTHNNFTTADLLKQPYIPIIDPYVSFYLGFNCYLTDVANKELTLLFPIQQSYALSTRFNYDPSCATIVWQYYDGYYWKDLAVNDATLDLHIPGIITFKIPADWQYALLFGRQLFWIRFQNTGDARPSTKGIYPNSVTACNEISSNNEILGSSNGRPSQEFQFTNKNILASQKIAVIETQTIDLVDNIAVELSELITTKNLNSQNNKMVAWQEVASFTFSTPTSRHYMLDHQAGKILFGNGKQGMIPPKGVDNIIAVNYKSCLGALGNAEINTIKKLQTDNSKIQSVTNHIAATGGTNGYAMSDIKKQGPTYLRSFNRAVTQDD